MGQDWYLINLDKRQYSSQGKFENFFTFGPSLVEELFWPVPSVYIGQLPPAKNAHIDICTSLSSSIFCRLPLELFDGVFENIDDYFDCVCLGLTCRRLWGVARRHVKKRYIEDAPGSWAGDRIICAGYLCARDASFPSGLLTEEEEKEWDTPLPIIGCGCEDTHEADTLSPSLADFAVCRFTREDTPYKIRRNTERRATRDAMRRRIYGDDWKVLQTVLDIPETPVYQEVKIEAPQVLRNLSRKEYVREDALDQFMKDEEELMEKYEYDICFGHVILMRACWSPNTYSPVPDPTDKMLEGPWAGDRFDFVSAKDFRALETGEDEQVVEWKDVSAEVVRDIKSLWALYL